MRCHVEFHCSWKVPLAKDGENKIFDGTKHRILLSFLLVTHTLSHKHWFTQKLVRRFIFRLKKYHLFFLTFMRYQIVLLSFLLKFLKIKKNLSSWILFSICYKRYTRLKIWTVNLLDSKTLILNLVAVNVLNLIWPV